MMCFFRTQSTIVESLFIVGIGYPECVRACLKIGRKTARVNINISQPYSGDWVLCILFGYEVSFSILFRVSVTFSNVLLNEHALTDFCRKVFYVCFDVIRIGSSVVFHRSWIIIE